MIKEISKYTNNNFNEDVLKFGLTILIHSTVTYILLIIFSYLLGVFYESIIAALSVSILRMFTGGTHVSNPIKCTIISIIIFIIIGFFIKNISLYNFNVNYLLIATFLTALFIVYNYSYSTTHNKKLKEYKHGLKLRNFSLVILLIWFTFLIINYNLYFTNILVISSCCGIMWHCFTLTKYGTKIFNLLNQI